MIKILEFFFWLGFSYVSTITMLLLKMGVPLRGWPYNWGGDNRDTLWFLLIIAIDSIKFLYILRWKYRLL